MPKAPASPITPLRVPPDGEAVLLFGGTFDPPTCAHVELAAAARDSMAPAAWLVFVPAARSPHKGDAPRASDSDRIAMVRAAIEGLPRAVVWTDEIDRGNDGAPSYTCDTLARARSLLGPHVPVRLLIGADQAASFHRWRDARSLFDLAAPVVIPREPYGPNGSLERALRAPGFWTGDQIARWLAAVAPVPILRTSATRVRDRLWTDGPDHPDVIGSLSPAVLEIIRRRGCYARSTQS